MLDYLILFISWVIYFFLHSALASDHIKESFIAAGRISAKKYRLVYSAISLLGLVAILVLQMYLPSTLMLQRTQFLILIGLIVASYGLLILKRAFKNISLLGFLGADDEKEDALIVEGFHGVVRHPIYLGTLLVVFGAVLFLPTDLMVVSALSIIVYLPVGIMLEEEKLVRKHGAAYISYKKEVPAIFPRIKSFFR